MKDKEVIIKKGSADSNYWQDFWDFKELLQILSWRDIKVRYKQTIIGVLWVVLRPIIGTIFFTVLFEKIAKLNTNSSVPYPLLIYVGMLPWQFFSGSINEASSSLINNANLVSKVYFPRIIIPVSTLVTALVDFSVNMIILLVLFIFYSFYPSVNLIFFPFVLLFLIFSTFGISIYFTAVNVKYRDFRYLIPFLIQFGMYVSPIGFSSSLITSKWYYLYIINPVVGVIDLFRWCILGDKFVVESFISSLIVSSLFFLFSLKYFRRLEKSFADNI